MARLVMVLVAALLAAWVVDVIVGHRKEHGHGVAGAAQGVETPDGDEAKRAGRCGGVHGPHCVTAVAVRA